MEGQSFDQLRMTKLWIVRGKPGELVSGTGLRQVVGGQNAQPEFHAGQLWRHGMGDDFPRAAVRDRYKSDAWMEMGANLPVQVYIHSPFP